MSKCGDCNYYCNERRICIIDEKFYFDDFASCEKYQENISIEDIDMMGFISDMESFK